MWTFEQRGKFQTRDDAWVAWREFCRLVGVRGVRSVEGYPWVYAVVPELHSDGETWHLHVAVRGLFDVTTLRVLWYRALGGEGHERGSATPGSVNAKYFKRRRGRQVCRSISNYVSGYVGKGLAGGEAERKSFATSKDLLPVDVELYHQRLGTDPEDWLDIGEACNALALQLGLGEVWPCLRSYGGRWVAVFDTG